MYDFQNETINETHGLWLFLMPATGLDSQKFTITSMAECRGGIEEFHSYRKEAALLSGDMATETSLLPDSSRAAGLITSHFMLALLQSYISLLSDYFEDVTSLENVALADVNAFPSQIKTFRTGSSNALIAFVRLAVKINNNKKKSNFSFVVALNKLQRTDR